MSVLNSAIKYYYEYLYITNCFWLFFACHLKDFSFESPEPDFGGGGDGGQSNADLLAALSAATQDIGEDNLAFVFDNMDDTSF